MHGKNTTSQRCQALPKTSKLREKPVADCPPRTPFQDYDLSTGPSNSEPLSFCLPHHELPRIHHVLFNLESAGLIGIPLSGSIMHCRHLMERGGTAEAPDVRV